MVGRREGVPLEALSPEDDVVIVAPADAHRRRWWTRRWAVAIALAGAVALVAAGPVRLFVSGRALQKAAGAFAAYQGFESERLALNAEVAALATPNDQADEVRAISAVEREEAGRLRGLAATLASPLGADARVRSAVVAVRGAIRSEAAFWDSHANWEDDPRGVGPPAQTEATSLMDGAASVLGAELARAHRRLPKIVLRRLHAADAVIARLHVWDDQPTGVTLAATDGGPALLRLDVDASRASSADLSSVTSGHVLSGFLVARAGWTAVFDGTRVIAAPTTGAPHVLPPGFATAMFAADRPDAIWVVADRQIVEVDEHGDRLSTTWSLPADAMITGLITGGFVTTTNAGILEAWTPAGGPGRPISKSPAWLLATQADRVAWAPQQPGPAPIHVTDVVTGSTRTLTAQPRITGSGTAFNTACAFSPDGSLLACPDLTSGQGGFPDTVYQLAIVNLAAGTETIMAGAVSLTPQQPLLWTTDSRNLFFLTSRQRSAVTTWPRDAPTAIELRYIPPLDPVGRPRPLTGLAILTR